jgi:hypothetical protein
VPQAAPAQEPKEHLLILTARTGGHPTLDDPFGFNFQPFCEKCRAFVDPENPGPHDLGSLYGKGGLRH